MVVFVPLAARALTVMVYVPLVAREFTVIVIVALPPVVTVDDENDAVIRLDEVVALNVTLWFVPVTTAVCTVVVAVPPMTAVPEVGLRVTEKSFGTLTVKL